MFNDSKNRDVGRRLEDIMSSKLKIRVVEVKNALRKISLKKLYDHTVSPLMFEFFIFYFLERYFINIKEGRPPKKQATASYIINSKKTRKTIILLAQLVTKNKTDYQAEE